MEKTHKIALLSLASCFAVAATLCTSSAKLSRNVEASAETLTTNTVQYSLPQLSFTAVDADGYAYVVQHNYTFTYDLVDMHLRLYEVGDYVQDTDPRLADILILSFTDTLQSGFSFDFFYTEDASFGYALCDWSFTFLNLPKDGVLASYSCDIALNTDEQIIFYYTFYDSADVECFDLSFSARFPQVTSVVLNTGYVLLVDAGSYVEYSCGALPVSPYLFSYEKGFSDGYADGRQDGYFDGYADGINNATDEEGLSWKKLFTSMIDVPINAIRSLFNFEILGYNVSAFLFSLLTIAVVLTVVNLIL